ncbi:MAG: vitamin K epoxide reductase family protein [Candidatus Heimdallarchaeota archaeon]|nr:vitamin K epoxide reductase family protein [Candidatus Heimdallarchaeota archaeon]
MEIRKSVLFLASIAGIADSFYLTDKHYNANGACSTDIREFFGYPVDCGYIDSTKYSEIFSIPLALFGLMYYLTIFGILYFDSSIDKKINQLQIHEKFQSHLDLVLIISTIGILYTFYLMYIQFVVLEIVCIYCLYSALSTSVIFGIAISYQFTTK